MVQKCSVKNNTENKINQKTHANQLQATIFDGMIGLLQH